MWTKSRNFITFSRHLAGKFKQCFVRPGTHITRFGVWSKRRTRKKNPLFLCRAIGVIAQAQAFSKQHPDRWAGGYCFRDAQHKAWQAVKHHAQAG